MKKPGISAIFAATVIIAGAIFVAVGSNSVAADTTTYRYGKIKIPGKAGALCGAPIYVAYTKGFLAKEGFDVELISADTETRKTYLNNGEIPVVNGDFEYFPSMENGVKIKVVEGLHEGCVKIIVPIDSPIKTAADLKGKKIGVDEIGGTPFQVASVWLEKNGISAKPADGQVTFLPFSDGALEVAALDNGETAASALWDPFGSVKEKSGKYRVILDIATDEPFANKYCCFLYASNKWLTEKPEQVAAILRAYHAAQDWIHNNPEETVKLIIDNKFSAIEDEELAIELIKHYKMPAHSEHATRDVKGQVEFFADELRSIDYLKTPGKEFSDKYYEKVDLNLGKLD